jgi:hypothetical protein
MAAFIGVLAVALLWRFALLLGTTVFEAGGLPYEAAQFQSSSALTGSGFTTAESDLVVRNPAARRVARGLFIFGYIGPASVLALLGVGVFSPTGESATAKLLTAATVVAALVIAIRADPAVRAQVSLAHWVGRRLVAARQPTMWVVGPGAAVASVFVHDGDAAVGRRIADWTAPGIEVLGIGSLQDGSEQWTTRPDPGRTLRASDRVLLFGDEHALRSMPA